MNKLIKKSYIYIFFYSVSFFVARITIFHILNPISIAFLGNMLFKGTLYFFVYYLFLIYFLKKKSIIKFYIKFYFQVYLF